MAGWLEGSDRARNLIRFVAQAVRADLLKSFWYALRLRSVNLVIYPKTWTSIHRHARITGKGRLAMGCRWAGFGFYQSELHLADNAHLHINGFFNIHTGAHIAIAKNAVLELGSGYVNSNVTMDCFNHIRIGQEVAISKGVTIRDSDNHEIEGGGAKDAPIIIGNHVWIGLNAVILKGVRIGDNAVIAAGSVVIRDVPSGALVAGVPARVRKKGIHWV